MNDSLLREKIERCRALFAKLYEDGYSKPDSYVKCYHQKFRDGTGGWTAAEKWSYWSAILWYRSDDCQGLPDDDQALLIMCETKDSEWMRTRGKIFGPKFTLVDGKWHNERALEYCIEAVEDYAARCAKTKGAGMASADNRAERKALRDALRNAERNAERNGERNGGKEKSKTLPKGKEGAVLGEFPQSLQTSNFEAAWFKWEQFRVELKHRLTPSTAEAQLKFLSTFGAAKAVEIIETSIRNGWQGLFEPKQSYGNKTNQPNPRNIGIAKCGMSYGDAARLIAKRQQEARLAKEMAANRQPDQAPAA